MADPTTPLPAFAVSARYFDGQSAGARVVRGVAEQMKGRLQIVDEESGRLLEEWPLEELRMIRDPGFGDGIVFFREGHDEARLNVASAQDAAALEAVAPNLRKVSVAKGTTRKVLFWTGGAVAALLLILFVILPTLSDTLAGLISPEQEETIGTTVVAQMEGMLGSHNGSGFCTSDAGQAALDKMAERLTGHIELPYPLKLKVIRHPMVNAFAAPGGHIVIVSGLLDKADSPEEVAGVLAHEIGHVYNRDPLRITLRTAGSAGILSMILGDFAGGALVLVISQQLMQASFSREAEAGADVFAFEALREAELPTEGIARFFEKLRDRYGDSEGAMEYLASHPNLASRAIAARAAESRGKDDFEPVLSAAEWDALKVICK
ncbi:M48 family metalloprotease [Oceanicola sp. 502str15]|uniref:M48 family metallopeptidase n=1 Tax=Oceanicola sp. 502str15 TaxID=2696061 RepID=UPI0020959902|nr:M48 family metalloprotease [Oceanicola sp. 502str15]